MYEEIRLFDYELDLKVLMDKHFPNFTEQPQSIPTSRAYHLIEGLNGRICEELYITIVTKEIGKSPNSIVSFTGYKKSGVEQRLKNFQRVTGIELKIAPQELIKDSKRNIIKFEKGLTTIKA